MVAIGGGVMHVGVYVQAHVHQCSAAGGDAVRLVHIGGVGIQTGQLEAAHLGYPKKRLPSDSVWIS